MANLFEQEVDEARKSSGIDDLLDPSESDCIALIRFAQWYGTARRLPCSAAQAVKQQEAWNVFHTTFQSLFPGKNWSCTKKYHNGAYHVHTIGFAFGGWELVSTNLFEVFNKFMKRVVRDQTNRKAIAKQVNSFNEISYDI